MGGFYGSTQLRTADRPRVLATAGAVAREAGIKCLVGPALNGWVGVYPEGHGQDHAVGERLAAAVGGHALHVLVHDDDDALAYWLWHDGHRGWAADAVTDAVRDDRTRALGVYTSGTAATRPSHFRRSRPTSGDPPPRR